MNLGKWLFLHYTEVFCKWCKDCLSLVICGMYLPYFLAHKTHRDFFVRNFRKK